MIKPTQDDELKADIDLLLDNLLRIFEVKCDDEKSFKYALTQEVCGFAEGFGYHRNCQIT